MSRRFYLRVHGPHRRTEASPLTSASAIDPRQFVQSSVTILSLYCFTALICLNHSTLQSFSTPVLFRFLVASCSFLTFSSTHALAPQSHAGKSPCFFVWYCSTPACTELCDNIILLLVHCTHLPSVRFALILSASNTVQNFDRSLLFPAIFIHAHNVFLAIPLKLSLLLLPLIHASLYRVLWE